MKLLPAFLWGLLFALGLGFGGMTQPMKVIGFLDLFGSWDPALVFVMGGAVGVTFLLFPMVLKRSKPLLETRFHLTPSLPVDWPLLIGAGLFGIGWGLSGYCPGPLLVSLASFNLEPWTFAFFFLLGLWLGRPRIGKSTS